MEAETTVDLSKIKVGIRVKINSPITKFRLWLLSRTFDLVAIVSPMDVEIEILMDDDLEE